MQKSLISSVKDGMALVNGKWMQLIGNLNAEKGDMVWNDGRCIFGNSMEGGGSIVTTSSDTDGIPLLQKYLSGKKYVYRHQCFMRSGLKNLSAENYVSRYFINRGNNFKFVDSSVLDAELDASGNLYTLEDGYVICDYATGKCTMCGGEIKRNGEVIKKYNLAPIVEEYLQEARSWAEGRTRPIEGEDPQSDTTYDTALCYPLAGRIDSQGNYMLVVFLQASVRNSKYAYEEDPYSAGGDPFHPVYDYGVRGNDATKDITTRFLFDGQIRTEWFYKANCYWTYYVSWGSIPIDSSKETIERFMTAWNLKYSIGDGYFITFAGEAEYKPMLFSDDLYTVRIHNPIGEVIFTGELQPIYRINICQIAKGRCLVQNGDYLYVFDEGKVVQKLSGYFDTLRLRKMKNINKWKRKGDV